MFTKEKANDIYPGLIIAFGIASLAQLIEFYLPIHIIGASVIALFMGIFLRTTVGVAPTFATGIQFTSKKVLKFAIILLGASLNIQTILTVGRMSLSVMFFTLLTCFGGGYFIGKALKLDWKLSSMISAGTGICGGSAIAAMAPVIEAEDHDIAYAISSTFLFDMVMIILFPIMGRALQLTDISYGLWAGTAVNDTSSVVAAGYAFSEAAGDFATMVKLTRTLTIIPTVLIFSVIARSKNKMESTNEKTSLVARTVGLFPWFIVLFIGMALLNSVGVINSQIALNLKMFSRFFMVAALAAIGLKTDLSKMKTAGFNPMIHGFIISTLVVIVSITVQYYMGIV
ncbi:YeiH family protein [Lacticigenium naphthae]|uniref:YeiH family protein n=1 Tax=Lacticigenium naphthae TaxID=515351 RepID=UPI000417777E|nr:putative sulfate exporter family transporter [Lacticigenium naphthae]